MQPLNNAPARSDISQRHDSSTLECVGSHDSSVTKLWANEKRQRANPSVNFRKRSLSSLKLHAQATRVRHLIYCFEELEWN